MPLSYWPVLTSSSSDGHSTLCWSVRVPQKEYSSFVGNSSRRWTRSASSISVAEQCRICDSGPLYVEALLVDLEVSVFPAHAILEAQFDLFVIDVGHVCPASVTRSSDA